MSCFASLICAASTLVVLQFPALPNGRDVAPAPREKIPFVEVAPARERHALILCGHPGDAEHAKSD